MGPPTIHRFLDVSHPDYSSCGLDDSFYFEELYISPHSLGPGKGMGIVYLLDRGVSDVDHVVARLDERFRVVDHCLQYWIKVGLTRVEVVDPCFLDLIEASSTCFGLDGWV